MKRAALHLFKFLIIAVLVATVPVYARRNCVSVLNASNQLTDALIARDTVSIKKLVDSSIGYGHSNGWIETRGEMTRDLFDGTLRYHSIRLIDSPTCRLQNGIAIVRQRVAISIEMKGTPLEMNLGVLQIWERHRKSWVLIARQSVRIY